VLVAEAWPAGHETPDVVGRCCTGQVLRGCVWAGRRGGDTGTGTSTSRDWHLLDAVRLPHPITLQVKRGGVSKGDGIPLADVTTLADFGEGPGYWWSVADHGSGSKHGPSSPRRHEGEATLAPVSGLS
jgi:hypothetical protein